VTIRNGGSSRSAIAAPRNIPNLRTIDLGGRTVVRADSKHTSNHQPCQPAGYHTILEKHELDSRDPGDLCRPPQGRAGRSVDHVDGRLAPEPMDRASPAESPRTWTKRYQTGQCCSMNASPARGNEQSRQEAVRTPWMRPPPVQSGHQAGRRRGRLGPSPRRDSPAAAPQQARSFTCGACKRSRQAAQHTEAMSYSTALGLTAHLDQVLSPTSGPLHPSQSSEPRSVPIVRLVDRAASR
jgi:hypothetical protein